MKDKLLHIKEPFFSAGKKYKWPGNSIGIGINIYFLHGEGNVRTTIGDNETVWVLEKKKAREWVIKYNSYFQAKTVRLGVIPWYLFSKEEEEKKLVKENKQINLL